MKIINFETDVIEFELDKEGEAFAAISKNPYITWAKFTLTDDQPNKNKQRVPKEEFDNLIQTGVHMPIKMAYSEISEGHDETYPIGVITHLKKLKNKVIGLAALWDSERPEDVNLIKEKFNKNEPLNLSWELAYSSEDKDESGITNLFGVSLKAATLVGMPAYAGRTQITAVASEEKGDDTLDELEKIKEQLANALAELETLKTEKQELETKASSLDKELEELRQFKAEVEAAKERKARLEAIKGKFSEAGIEKDAEYFEEKAELLLGLDEAGLDFLIQEALAFASELKEKEPKKEEASLKKVPAFPPEKEEKLSLAEMAKLLREGK